MLFAWCNKRKHFLQDAVLIYPLLILCILYLQDGADDEDNEGGLDFNFTAGSNDAFSQDATVQGSFNETALNGTILTGDRLINQPRKVRWFEMQ